MAGRKYLWQGVGIYKSVLRNSWPSYHGLCLFFSSSCDLKLARHLCILRHGIQHVNERGISDIPKAEAHSDQAVPSARYCHRQVVMRALAIISSYGTCSKLAVYSFCAAPSSCCEGKNSRKLSPTALPTEPTTEPSGRHMQCSVSAMGHVPRAAHAQSAHAAEADLSKDILSNLSRMDY